MTVLFETQQGPAGVLRVSQQRFRGLDRVDIREFFRPEGGEDLVPTRRGVSVRIGQLPALRAALERAEQEAIRSGLLPRSEHEGADVSASSK